MKMVYTAMLVLLCWMGIYAQEHEYVPMLREDLVWVGFCQSTVMYCIKVNGDTVVNGIAYKKCYRYRQDAEYVQYTSTETSRYRGYPWFFTDPYVPASCMREENGKVYRLCDKNVEYVSSFMIADENYTTPRINETETHYEVLVYDFDQPNIYHFHEDETELHPSGEVMLDGQSRRVFTNSGFYGYGNRVLIEGFGMLGQGYRGSDMLEPSRYKEAVRPVFGSGDLDIWYVRNSSGDVLYHWGNLRGAQDENLDEGCARYHNDPYDFDDDNNFDIADVNAMINIMLDKREDFYDKSADITFDQKVDIEDMNLVINRLLSGVKPVKRTELLQSEAE